MVLEMEITPYLSSYDIRSVSSQLTSCLLVQCLQK